MYGTTDATMWSVTFVTREMKRGRLVCLADHQYALIGDYQVYYFQEDQVVHLSPHISRTDIHAPKWQSDKV
jgi:hypothetical protein